jgi:hypothetical protein
MKDEVGKAYGTYWVFSWGNMKEIDHLEDLGISGRMILKWTLNRRKSVNWVNLAATGCCEYGDERLGSVKCGEFHDWLRNG